MKTKYYKLLPFILPALLIYLTFIIYPFGYSFFLSFFSWSGVGEKIFVGLKNFREMLFGNYSKEFFNALKHNIYIFFMLTVFELGFGFFIATLLITNIRGRRIFQTVAYLPNIVSMVLVGFIWSMLLNPQWGLINQILRTAGFSSLAKPWLGDPNTALNTIIFVNIWRNVGFYILVLLAAIIDIPPELFEAAYIDGASNWKVVWQIIFPLTIPTFQTLTVLLFIWSFNIFDIVYALEGVQAGPFRSTDVLGTLFYRTAFGGLGSAATDLGLGAAVAVLIFIMVIPLSLLYVYMVERRSRR
ncbi:MAG: sugar ABC transporter permease [Thermotogae bacterium]|nr:sugar ABC transporter permease [Thermotogota bacterium]